MEAEKDIFRRSSAKRYTKGRSESSQNKKRKWSRRENDYSQA